MPVVAFSAVPRGPSSIPALLQPPLCLAACKGQLRGAAVSPTPNLLLPPMLFIAAFSSDLVGKLDAVDGKILAAMA